MPAEGLVFPTGLLLAAFLTRRLGPHDYELYTRTVSLTMPIASLVAGASEEIVALALGEQFLPAASVLTVLIFATLAMIIVSVAMTILIAAGKPR